MAGLGGLLGNSVLEQLFLYNILGQLIGAALTPAVTAATNDAQSHFPFVPLAPADAADAVIRNILTEDLARQEAAQGGVNEQRFGWLVQLAGNAPDPTSLAVGLRRGLIVEDRYLQGIAQGRLRDEWADLVRELAVEQPTPMDAMTALVEGQLDEQTARDKFAAFGGDVTQFDWLFGTVGAGPSPLEAGMMAHRGLIPWDGVGLGVVSFSQAVHEGHTRNKWETAYKGLTEYLPPPRTVTAMHREGALSDAQAAHILEEHGLSSELAAAYLLSSSKTKTAKPRELAQGIVEKLYLDRLIPRATAATFLERLGYDVTEADFILSVVDLALAERFMTSGVNRIHSLFVAHKISKAGATEALSGLGVDATSASSLVAEWDHERVANVRRLTPAQVVAAYGNSIIDQATAQGILESDGYSPWDAWVILSDHHKGPLPGEPSRGALGPAAGP